MDCPAGRCIGHHRLEYAGVERRRRIIIEIDPSHGEIIKTVMLSPLPNFFARAIIFSAAVSKFLADKIIFCSCSLATTSVRPSLDRKKRSPGR